MLVAHVVEEFDLKLTNLVHRDFLQQVLGDYFNEESKAEEMTNYILEQRQEKVKDEIKRKKK